MSLDYSNNIIMIALNDHGLNSGADAYIDPNGKQPPKPYTANTYEPLIAMVMLTDRKSVV